MGRICSIYDTSQWKLEGVSGVGKECNNTVASVIVGSCDDYDGFTETSIWMDKQLFIDIKYSTKYTVIKQPYSDNIIKVIDDKNKEIDIITGKEIMDKKVITEGDVDIMKKTICFDFDGVINSYESGWKGIDCIPDKPVDGITEVINQLRKEDDYWVVISSSRCKQPSGIKAIEDYLNLYNIEVDEISAEKPPAVCYVDDRAVLFNGHCDDLVEQIKNFKNWINKPAPTGTVLEFVYTNWKGKTSTRHIIKESMQISMKTTSWHGTDKWIMYAYDSDKQDYRSFAVEDIDIADRYKIIADVYSLPYQLTNVKINEN